MTEQTYINLPPWDGRPREMGLLWELHKGGRVAVCHLWTHAYPSGPGVPYCVMRVKVN